MQLQFREPMNRAALFCLLAVAACRNGARVETMPAPAGRNLADVHTLWIAPNGALLGDALAVELARQGFSVVDRAGSTNEALRLNATEAELIRPQNLDELRRSGVDAMVFVRSAQGRDGNPQSATVRVISTRDGVMIGGATWRNGGSYSRGSIDNGTTARRIAEALHRSFVGER